MKRRMLIALALVIPGAWLTWRSAPKCGDLDERRIRADFAAGRTVFINGWLMSQHEAQHKARCVK